MSAPYAGGQYGGAVGGGAAGMDVQGGGAGGMASVMAPQGVTYLCGGACLMSAVGWVGGRSTGGCVWVDGRYSIAPRP